MTQQDPQLEPQRPVAPNTTVEQDKLTANQRSVNIIWEVTQAVIAVAVTASALYVSSVLATQIRPDASAAFLLLSNAFFLVIGFYFSRTNHARIGDDRGPKIDDRR